MSSGKQIFAKFLNDEILGEMGRLLFTLLNAFAANGYHIRLFHNIDIEKLEKHNRPYIRLLESIDNLRMVDSVPGNTGDIIYLFDSKERALSRKGWKKEIHVRFDIYSTYLFSSFREAQTVFFPYPMHPLNYETGLPLRLEEARRTEKKVRIFFSGDTEGYKRNRIHYPADKLTRTEIIEVIHDEMDSRVDSVEDAAILEDLLEGNYRQRFILVDNTKTRIDAQAWLETLSKADFFLCPPGYVMPMCHNVIEAMAVGTIPIINYPEWLNPDLEDTVNCMAFDDRESLISTITQVLNMNQETINNMKNRVIDYYDSNLDPKRFIQKIESIPCKEITLLMTTDANVANNEFGLNRNSILITGKPMRPIDWWSDIRHTLHI